MSGEKYLINRKFVIICIIITAGWIINANGKSNNATNVFVSVGQILILDCYLSGKNTTYPVHWNTGSENIGVLHTTNISPDPYINKSLYPQHRVTLSNRSGSWLFSLKMLEVEPSDAGEYGCIDSTVPTPHQLQTFDVNLVTCQCSTADGVEDITGNERLAVNCILQGYQPQRNSASSVTITLDGSTIEGYDLQANVLKTYVEVRHFCMDIFLKVHFNAHFSSRIQCQIPCPFSTTSAANVRLPPISTTPVQVPTLQTTEKRNTCTSAIFTGTAKMHTLSPSSSVKANKSILLNTASSFTIAETKSIMYTSTTSPTKNIILISTSIAFAIAVTIGIVIIVCVLRRNKRNHKIITREQGEQPPIGQPHYENVQGSNGAGNQVEDSNIDLILNTVYEPILIASTSMQPSASTQIKQDAIDAGPSISRPKTLQSSQTSGTSCTQYANLDVSGGIEAYIRMAQPVIDYQDLNPETRCLHSKYKSLDLPGSTGKSDDRKASPQQQIIQKPSTSCIQYASLDLPESTEESDDKCFSRQQQVVQERSNSCIEYTSLEIPSAMGEGEKGDAPLYAVLEE